jgi:hypothetical protein
LVVWQAQHDRLKEHLPNKEKARLIQQQHRLETEVQPHPSRQLCIYLKRCLQAKHLLRRVRSATPLETTQREPESTLAHGEPSMEAGPAGSRSPSPLFDSSLSPEEGAAARDRRASPTATELSLDAASELPGSSTGGRGGDPVALLAQAGYLRSFNELEEAWGTMVKQQVDGALRSERGIQIETLQAREAYRATAEAAEVQMEDVLYQVDRAQQGLEARKQRANHRLEIESTPRFGGGAGSGSRAGSGAGSGSYHVGQRTPPYRMGSRSSSPTASPKLSSRSPGGGREEVQSLRGDYIPPFPPPRCSPSLSLWSFTPCRFSRL